MIVYYNICDNCGNQNQIISGSAGSGVSFTFYVFPTYEVKSLMFSKNEEVTFCNKECLLSYLKDNLTKSGLFLEKEKDDYVE